MRSSGSRCSASPRGLQAILLADIQRSFTVSDATIGALRGLAGVLAGSALAVPLARLADRISRKLVLVGLMVTGASAGFYFGEAIVGAGTALIDGALEPWRQALLVLAAGGAPLLLLALATVDPPRGVAAAEKGEQDALGPFLLERWRAIGLFVDVAGSLAVAVQALNPLIALALQRRFGAELGVIGQTIGWVTLVSTIGCLPIAGLLDRWLRPRFGLAARPLVTGAGALLAISCAAGLLLAEDLNHALAYVGLFLLTTCISNALVPTALQDLTPATLRARSYAVWSFVVSVFCAVGPLVAGTVSDVALGGNLLAAIALTSVPALAIPMMCAVRSVWRAPVVAIA